MKSFLTMLLIMNGWLLSGYAQKSTKNTPFYILNVSAENSESAAKQQVAKLKKMGYNADYLWIPDYASLSGAKLFAVYIGPYETQSECELATEEYRKNHPNAYGLLVSTEKKRVQINGIGKVRISDIQQKGITQTDKTNSAPTSSLTVSQTKSCIVNYDWIFYVSGTITEAWKFSSDGTFNYSQMSPVGSLWGVWSIIAPGKINISFTRNSGIPIPESTIGNLINCTHLSVNNKTYVKE